MDWNVLAIGWDSKGFKTKACGNYSEMIRALRGDGL